MFTSEGSLEQVLVFEVAIGHDLNRICPMAFIILLATVTIGCSHSQQPVTKATAMTQAEDIAGIDDLKVIRLPHDSDVVPDGDFDKTAILDALRQQKFKPSNDKKPPGLPEWRIVLFSRGKEAFSLDLYGPYGELAYDRKNDRYFSWEYWDRFAQELVANKSSFSSRLPAGLKSSGGANKNVPNQD